MLSPRAERHPRLVLVIPAVPIGELARKKLIRQLQGPPASHVALPLVWFVVQVMAAGLRVSPSPSASSTGAAPQHGVTASP